MKSIITIGLLLAAGTTLANATPVAEKDMFSSEFSWTSNSNRGGRTFVIDSSGDTCTLTNSNWSQSCAYYEFSDSLTVGLGETLNFSFDMNVGHLNGSFTFTLQSADLSLALGKNYDSTAFNYGKTSDVSKSVYLFQNGGVGTYSGAITSDVQSISDFSIAANSKFTVSGEISAPSSEGENFTLKLIVGDKEVSSFDLGTTSFSLKKLGFYGDGVNSVTNVTFSDLKISVVPEPSAFGLLAGAGALALVAARRRQRRAK